MVTVTIKSELNTLVSLYQCYTHVKKKQNARVFTPPKTHLSIFAFLFLLLASLVLWRLGHQPIYKTE